MPPGEIASLRETDLVLLSVHVPVQRINEHASRECDEKKSGIYGNPEEDHHGCGKCSGKGKSTEQVGIDEPFDCTVDRAGDHFAAVFSELFCMVTCIRSPVQKRRVVVKATMWGMSSGSE